MRREMNVCGGGEAAGVDLDERSQPESGSAVREARGLNIPEFIALIWSNRMYIRHFCMF